MTALRIGSGPVEHDGKQHRLYFQTSAHNGEPTVPIIPFEYPAHFSVPLVQNCRLTPANGRFENAAAADSLPLFVIIGRLISHPAPLTCTWRCSGKRSRHPSFGGAPPSGSELLHSNTPSRSQFAAGPASVSAARHIADEVDEVLSGCLLFLLV